MNQISISVLLKELRGKKSQLEMSQSLGFNFNQYHKWESGSTSITLQNFLDLSHYLDINIEKIFSELLEYSLVEYSQTEMLSKLYFRWFTYSEECFLESINFTKSKWWRLKNGKAKLTLAAFLDFIEVISSKKHSFLSVISKDFKKKRHLHKPKNEEILFESIRLFPEFSTIYSSLFLKEFISSKSSGERKKVLTKSTGLSLSRLETILSHLEKNKILELDRKDLEKPYKVAISKSSIEINDIIAIYCLKRSLEKMNKGRNNEHIIATPIIAAVSEKAEAEIAQIFTKCWRDITQTISNDDNSNKTKVLHMYLGKVY